MMKLVRRSGVVVVSALVGVALIAASCSSSSGGDGGDGAASTTTLDLNQVNEAPNPPQLGGTLRVGLNAETDGWNPTSNQWAGSAYIVANAIFDRLMALDPEGNPKPYLALAVEPNADFTEWVIRLRPAVEFHDGTPVDAEAVKLNLDKHKASVLTAPSFQLVDRVEVVDPSTVRVVMVSPWATFGYALSFQTGFVAAPSMLNDPDGSRNPVGSGPFRFVNWVPDNRLEVTANDTYWREGMPYLDGVEFKVLPDNSTRTLALTTGQVDVLETSDPASLIALSAEASAGKVQVFTGDPNETSVGLVALNMATAPFDDPLARRIVATGTDRQTASEVGYLGVFPPADGPFDTTSPYFAETDYPDYDLEEARRLNEEYRAKYGKGLSYSVHIPGTPEIKAVLEAAQARFLSIGVDMQIETMDQPRLVSQALLGDYQATGFILFGQPTLDRDYVFISGNTVRPVGQFSLNFVRNPDPVLTEALDDSRAASDEASRTESYRIVQERLAAELPYVYSVRYRSAIGTSNQVHGLAEWTFPDGRPGRPTTTNLITAGAWLSP
jgi:ABC-type transport system substrate-binding protein